MNKTLLVISIVLLLATAACNTALPKAEATTAPTIQAISTQPQTQGQAGLPQTEDAVPRVAVAEAKLAFDNGEAVIVDVRSAESYTASHAAGAISIPLAEFELNIDNLPLDKNQWIITYCS